MSRWRSLPAEQRQAAAAAAALAASMLLPWYEKSLLVQGAGGVSDNLSALQVFSFVEAAVLLVAGGVLYLLWARSERRAFHLPGGDGWVVTAAGAWAVLLLVWRLFDKPDVAGPGATIGVQWGIFVALGTAGVLTAAGQRIRAAHRPEPANPADGRGWETPGRRRRERRGRVPVDPDSVTRVLSERPPAWEGEPPPPLDRARPNEEPGSEPAPPPRTAAGDPPPAKAPPPAGRPDAGAPATGRRTERPDEDEAPGPAPAPDRLF